MSSTWYAHTKQASFWFFLFCAKVRVVVAKKSVSVGVILVRELSTQGITKQLKQFLSFHVVVSDYETKTKHKSTADQSTAKRFILFSIVFSTNPH